MLVVVLAGAFGWGKSAMRLAKRGLIRAEGTMLGQPATFLQTGLNASTVVLLGPGTVATPGAEEAMSCLRIVGSPLPLKGLEMLQAVAGAGGGPAGKLFVPVKSPRRKPNLGMRSLIVFASGRRPVDCSDKE